MGRVCFFKTRHAAVMCTLICICHTPYLIFQNIVIDEGEHLHREPLVMQRKCNSGVAHNGEQGGGIDVVLVLATERHFVRASILGKTPHQNLVDTQPFNNDVPAGGVRSILLGSGPAALQDQLQVWVRRLQSHFEVQRFPQIFCYWEVFILVEILIGRVCGRIRSVNTGGLLVIKVIFTVGESHLHVHASLANLRHEITASCLVVIGNRLCLVDHVVAGNGLSMDEKAHPGMAECIRRSPTHLTCSQDQLATYGSPSCKRCGFDGGRSRSRTPCSCRRTKAGWCSQATVYRFSV